MVIYIVSKEYVKTDKLLERMRRNPGIGDRNLEAIARVRESLSGTHEKAM